MTAALVACGGSDGTGHDGGPSSMDGATVDGGGAIDGGGSDAALTPGDYLCITTASRGERCYSGAMVERTRTVDSGIVHIRFQAPPDAFEPLLSLSFSMPDGAALPYRARDAEVRFLTSFECMHGQWSDCRHRWNYTVARCIAFGDPTLADAQVTGQSPTGAAGVFSLPIPFDAALADACDCYLPCEGGVPGENAFNDDPAEVRFDLLF